MENSICEKGLLAFRDSSNCKRHNYRRADGSIPANAAGISLAPLGARAQEIYALAYQHKENKNKLRELFDELFTVRHEVRRIQSNPDLTPSISETVQKLLSDLPKRKTAAADVGAMAALLARAKDMLEKLRTLLGCSNKPAREAKPAAVQAACEDPRPQMTKATATGSLESRPGHFCGPCTAKMRCIKNQNLRNLKMIQICWIC